MDRFPAKNITAKLVALFLAAVLWMYVMNEQNPSLDTSFQVPLEVYNLAGNVIPVDIPETVRIKVRGPRSLMANFGVQDMKAYVDLKGLTAGRYAVKIQTAIPSSMEIVEVNPDKFSLKLDELGNRQVPLSIKVTGAPGPETVISKIAGNLTEVTVEGRKSLLDTVDTVIAPIDVTGKKADFTEEVPLVLINREGRAIEGLTISPDKVKVSIGVLRSTDKKMVDIKPIIASQLPKGMILTRIITEPEKVEIYGERQLLEKVDFVYTEPIELAEIDKSMDKVVKLQLKEGLVAAPSTVKVHISVSKTL